MKIKCPYGCVDGELSLVSDLTTTLGCMGLDTNRKNEVFRCSVCHRLVSRHWEWEAVASGVDRPHNYLPRIPEPPPGPGPVTKE